MITTLFGHKKNQTRIFAEDGTQVMVTNIVVDPCVITREVNATTNRYQIGMGIAKKLNKSVEGILKKAGIETKARFFREVTSSEPMTVGTEIKVSDVLAAGDTLTITGTGKGKGFAGGVRRHGFSGGPKTHGQGDRWRAPGSIGAGTTPGRVYKGKRMAGRLGGETVTIRGFKVISVDAEKNIVSVSGPIPGARNGLIKLAKQG